MGAFAFAVIIAIALSRDPRVTIVHGVSAWLAAGVATMPVLGFVSRTRRSVVLDLAAAFGMVCGIGGSYTIGGLALLLPAGLVLVAGFLHFIATPEGQRVTRAETGRPKLIGGLLAALLGAFLGLSLSLLVLIGWALLVSAVYLLGSVLSARRRARGGGPSLGWVQAVGFVLGVYLLAWTIALSVEALF
jgi:hypothetical protein